MSRDLSDFRFKVFFVPLIIIYSLLIFELFSPFMQRIGLRQMHLRVKPFVVWCVLHLTPWMYNYANTMMIVSNPTHSQRNDPHILDNNGGAIWINHYPLHATTFDNGRKIISLSGEEWMVVSKAVYQKQSLVTRWYLRKNMVGVLEISQE